METKDPKTFKDVKVYAGAWRATDANYKNLFWDNGEDVRRITDTYFTILHS